MRITPTQYAQSWYQALQAAPKEEWNSISKRYLSYFHHHGLLKRLPEIVREIQRIETASRGVLPVIVRSSYSIDEDTATKIVSALLPKKAVTIKAETDPSLIGGCEIETENQRWNFSLRGQLHALEKMIAS